MTNKKAPEGAKLKKRRKDNSLAAQRQCVIDALRNAADGLTTIELREHFDVMMPASRIYELRWLYGYNIVRTRVHDTNAQGHSHNVARYVLLPGKWRETA